MLNFFISIVAITANILGSFQDPFEFAGDYGPEMNPTREKVFELVIPKNEPQITFADLIPPELLSRIEDPAVAAFLQENLDENAFHFLRNSPKDLLRIDKILRDRAAAQGQPLKLSILSSVYPLNGSTPTELKENLMDQLFKDEISDLIETVEVSDNQYEVFKTPSGQITFYWLYQSLNLHLVSQDPQLIREINKTKAVFSRTIGNPQKRAEAFQEKILAADTGVLFTQESDQIVVETLTKNGPFLYPIGQNPKDGCFILLKKDTWEKTVKMIPLENYKGYHNGKLNLLLATHKPSGQKFLLASCHGNSTNPEDGRLQISIIMQKFEGLSLQNPGLQLLIGIDANTKSERDVEAFNEHLDQLGLVATQVGPTTVKKRMVTVQHGKSGRVAIDQEDYLITLKPEKGGKFALSDPTVGFKKGPANQSQVLPNFETLSDHYPVGATLKSNF